jgi:DNA-binding transcriptional LysR family regulator
MHLRNVELFCDIVACRSFSRAAEMRKISQPAATQIIQQLEEHLGVSLFDRTVRPPELTPSGQLYYEKCRELLEMYRSIEDAVRRLGDKVVGRVRVASIYSVGLLQMAEYVRRFAELFPDVEVRLDYVHPDEVYARVRRDEADLGIVSYPSAGDDIAVCPWLDQEMVLVVQPGGSLTVHETATLDVIRGLDFVAFTPDLKIRKEIDRLLKRKNVQVKVTHQFDNVENIKRAVEIGAGVAILPLPTIRRELEIGSLHAVTLQDVDLKRPLGIVQRRHKHLPAAAEKFVAMLKENAGLGESATAGKVVSAS